MKWKIDIFGIGYIEHLKEDRASPRLIVSLTSYGRRVEKVVYYTIISILKQKLMPNKILLWLDQETWNDDNLPSNVSSLKKYGVEIRYYKDIRSYKKLIPSLKLFPNDIIITIDDDVQYSSLFLKRLYEGYLESPSKIQCFSYRIPKFENNKLLPYNKWESNGFNKLILPVGAGGVLYPPHSLHEDVINEELFIKLCPIADDLWFWIMGLKQGTEYNLPSTKGVYSYAFDDLYQYLHKGSALTHSNSQQNMNDVQIVNLFNYYSIKSESDLYFRTN